MKMKIPKLPRFKFRKRKRLRATTIARRPLRIAATADYDEMSEPNMKLSRALLIVLVLHVVAVSGIIAFNAIKTRQGSMPTSVPAASNPIVPVAPTTKADVPKTHAVPVQKETVRHDEAKPTHTTSKSIVKEERKAERAKTSDAAAASDSGKVYVVAKGDNPVTIAKRLKVSYDDLISLNHIEDPRKLQIGQKLLIPKAPKAKKADE